MDFMSLAGFKDTPSSYDLKSIKDKFRMVLKCFNTKDLSQERRKKQHDAMLMVGVLFKGDVKNWIIEDDENHSDTMAAVISLLADLQMGENSTDIKKIKNKCEERQEEMKPRWRPATQIKDTAGKRKARQGCECRAKYGRCSHKSCSCYKNSLACGMDCRCGQECTNQGKF